MSGETRPVAGKILESEGCGGGLGVGVGRRNVLKEKKKSYVLLTGSEFIKIGDRSQITVG